MLTAKCQELANVAAGKYYPSVTSTRNCWPSPGITDKDPTARGVKGQGSVGLAWASLGYILGGCTLMFSLLRVCPKDVTLLQIRSHLCACNCVGNTWAGCSYCCQARLRLYSTKEWGRLVKKHCAVIHKLCFRDTWGYSIRPGCTFWIYTYCFEEHLSVLWDWFRTLSLKSNNCVAISTDHCAWKQKYELDICQHRKITCLCFQFSSMDLACEDDKSATVTAEGRGPC